MTPVCTAIMPTKGRPRYAAQALQSFIDQDYPWKFLIILDDREDRSFASSPDYPNVWYGLLDKTLNIPTKRNLAVQMAKSEMIMHWDDDDVSGPTRMREQVKLLQESGRHVCAFHSIFFYDEQSNRATKYLGDHQYGIGTSLCYLRTFWEAHPFQENLQVGEDNEFIKAARERNQLISVDGGGLIVARTHAMNTSPRNPHALEYRSVSLDALPSGFPR